MLTEAEENNCEQILNSGLRLLGLSRDQLGQSVLPTVPDIVTSLRLDPAPQKIRFTLSDKS